MRVEHDHLETDLLDLYDISRTGPSELGAAWEADESRSDEIKTIVALLRCGKRIIDQPTGPMHVTNLGPHIDGEYSNEPGA